MASRNPHPTRDILIDAALELFAAGGFQGTTVRTIEQAAGLTPGAGGLYRHFKSKEDLLVAAVQRYTGEIAAFAERTPELLDLGDVRAELRLAAKILRRFNERNQSLLRVLHTEGRRLPRTARRAFETAWGDAYTIYARWLGARLGPGTKVDVEATAIQLFGALTQFQSQADIFKQPPLGVERDRFVEAWADHWTAFIASARGEG